MSSERYEHSQFGTLTVVILLLVSALVAIISWMTSVQAGPRIAMSVSLVFLALVFLLFYRLRVIVDSGQLAIRFGIGLISFHYPLADIVSAQAVRNKWYWGLGIRYYGAGWLFNVSGLDAVEIALKNGNKRRIGTDDPGGLAVALQEHGAEDAVEHFVAKGSSPQQE